MSDFKVKSRDGNKIFVEVDGTLLSGTIEKVSNTLKNLGYNADGLTKIYHSSADGDVLISNMATPHIRNAVQKLLREKVAKIGKVTDIAQWYEDVFDIVDQDFWETEFVDLMKELNDRINNE